VRRVSEGFLTAGIVGAFATFSDGLSTEAQNISTENSNYLLSVVVEEVKRHTESFDKTPKEHQAFLNQDWIDLLIDGNRRASATRTKERVKRIALILSTSAREGPTIPTDGVEEMMRVAMSLSDRDVQLLAKLASAEEKTVLQNGRLTRYQAWSMWPWANQVDSELESVFSKLEAYGLVTR
jgi:hypothetical protein